MDVELRSAEPSDAVEAVPLIYSSGPDAFDYVFGHAGGGNALSFLRHAFVDGAGEFGHRNHTVAVVDDRVVGVGAGYSGDIGMSFTVAAARQIFGVYGVAAPGVIVRGLRAERVIAPAKRHMLYLAHLGVGPDLRGKGIGTQLVKHFIAVGRDMGLITAELDVAVTNRRAEALYERLGFRVTDELGSGLRNEFGEVVNHRRLVIDL